MSNNIKIVLLVLFLICLGIGLLIYIIQNASKKKDKKDYQKYLYKASIISKFKHIEGLPVSSGAFVDLFYGNEKVTIVKDNREFIISMEKIIDVDVVTGKNLQSQIATGAIAGKYIIGGTAGAIVGSLLSTTLYIVFTYKKDEEYKFLIFDTASNTSQAMKIEKEFKQNNTTDIQSIEL